MLRTLAFFILHHYTDFTKGQKDARYILRRLEESGKDEISKRDLFKLVQGRLRRVDAMTPGLAELVKRGYICIQKNSTGGRPTEKIRINPIAQKTQNSQKILQGREQPLKCCENGEGSQFYDDLL